MTKRSELANVVLLLVNLAGTSFASRTLVNPLFGKSFGPMAFQFGAFLSFLLCSFIFSDAVKQQRRALLVMSVLQVAVAVIARSTGAYTASHVEDPTMAALVVHIALSFPVLGLGGAVWLQWTRKFADSEPTKLGRLTVKVFTCIALVTIVKFVEAPIGYAILDLVYIPPKVSLIGLSMMTYTLSIVFNADRSIFQTQQLSKMISVLSLYVVMFAISVPPKTPAGLIILYERYTPAGLVQVADSRLSLPAARYLRLDSSIVDAVELGSEDVLGDTTSSATSLLDAVKLVEGPKGDRALIIGVRTGTTAKALIAQSYNTTIIEGNRAVYNAARTYFALPEPAFIFIHDPVSWVRQNAAQANRPPAPDAKFDVIVHDVSQGGELPANLFTMEVWAAVRSLLDPAGVIAVKYVGKPNAVTFKSTLNMLRKNFATCKAYHSGSLDLSPLSASGDFSEIVIFCTPNASLDFAPISSTKPELKDSTLLAILNNREIDIAAVLSGTSPERYLLKEEDPIMGHWGRDGINDYWKVMRQRFPPSLWSSY